MPWPKGAEHVRLAVMLALLDYGRFTNGTLRTPAEHERSVRAFLASRDVEPPHFYGWAWGLWPQLYNSDPSYFPPVGEVREIMPPVADEVRRNVKHDRLYGVGCRVLLRALRREPFPADEMCAPGHGCGFCDLSRQVTELAKENEAVRSALRGGPDRERLLLGAIAMWGLEHADARVRMATVLCTTQAGRGGRKAMVDDLEAVSGPGAAKVWREVWAEEVRRKRAETEAREAEIERTEAAVKAVRNLARQLGVAGELGLDDGDDDDDWDGDEGDY